MSNVIIMRGIPGSGKTTYVGKHFPGAKVVSTDHYFEHLGRYDHARLPAANSRCFLEFLLLLEGNAPLVVVDNCNIHIWEFQNYVLAAKMLGHWVEVVSIVAETREEVVTCVGRNVHRANPCTIEAMAKEFERFVDPCGREVQVSELS